MCKGLGTIQEGILEFLADGKWVSPKDVQDVCKCAYEHQERQIFRSLTRLVAAGKVEKRWGSYDCEAGYCRMDNCDKSSYWYDPVSYTHLRAHETVLDLVCRLLLEKKKQTTD